VAGTFQKRSCCQNSRWSVLPGPLGFAGPVRILLPAFTGTGDLYWYVRADSPLKTVKDTTAANTIAYSTSGSSSNCKYNAIAANRSVAV